MSVVFITLQNQGFNKIKIPTGVTSKVQVNAVGIKIEV
jgi:hypothetical protein